MIGQAGSPVQFFLLQGIIDASHSLKSHRMGSPGEESVHLSEAKGMDMNLPKA